MKYCPHCNAFVPDHSRRCPHCRGMHAPVTWLLQAVLVAAVAATAAVVLFLR
jgi:RNA polymerase subunit RPABC4/transcription elongation factor Spt4